jgi:hypothetical protein
MYGASGSAADAAADDAVARLYGKRLDCLLEIC